MTNLENIFYQIPAFIFWKDKNSLFLGANENVIKSAGLNSPTEILGKSDFQLPWKTFADKYRDDDRTVIRDCKVLSLQEHHLDVSGRKTLATVNKKPLLNEQGKVVGVIGVYTKVFLENTHKVHLPKRQKEVLTALCNGLSAKQIASEFEISRRTVEYYIEIIKSKWGCQNKIELIKKAFKLGIN